MSDEKPKCDHGVKFDSEAAKTMTTQQVHERFPRFDGTCPTCGWSGIAYASWEHFVAGDW